MTTTTSRSFQPPTAARDAYRRLVKHLKTHCQPADRLPPIRELARLLNVGVGSVNLAVQQLAREGVLVSRTRLGTFVANMPTGREPQLTRLAGKTIAVINALDSDGMIATMGRTLEHELSTLGAQITHIRITANQMHAVQAHDTDAAVVINPNSHPDIAVAPGQQLLILQTAAESPVVPGTRYDEVTVDQQDAAAIAGQYLREVGCHSACYLGVHRGDEARTVSLTSQVRLEAFQRGWGASIPAAQQFYRRSYGESWGARMVAQYMQLEQKPDAIFAASDELAVGFVKGALALGLEPARDYQIIGFDGQQRGRDLLEGPLTTIMAPTELMAKRGAELLADRLLNPDQPTRRLQLGCTLFKGRTTRTP